MKAILVACALLAGCATQAPNPAPAPNLRELVSSLGVGRSTKSDVRAALGEGTVVDFASGFEVWVYRGQSEELVLLFEPAGILSKTRVR